LKWSTSTDTWHPKKVEKWYYHLNLVGYLWIFTYVAIDTILDGNKTRASLQLLATMKHCKFHEINKPFTNWCRISSYFFHSITTTGSSHAKKPCLDRLARSPTSRYPLRVDQSGWDGPIFYTHFLSKKMTKWVTKIDGCNGYIKYQLWWPKYKNDTHLMAKGTIRWWPKYPLYPFCPLYQSRWNQIILKKHPL
jgi:hypothetical protein